MATGTAIKAALKFFEKLSIEDLSSSFNSSELKKLRRLILQERKKPDSVVTGKDIGKINKAIKDRPKFEQAREEGMGKLTVDDDIRSGKTGRTSKEKARIRDDYREAAEEQYMAERGWPGPLKFKEIGPKVADPNVPVLKKPRRKTPVRPAKRKSSSEQTERNVSNRAFDKAIQDGVLTTNTLHANAITSSIISSSIIAYPGSAVEPAKLPASSNVIVVSPAARFSSNSAKDPENKVSLIDSPQK